MGATEDLGYRSTFLFAYPTWKEGVGRLMDFGDALTEYNSSPTPEDADIRALWMDWASVGDDLRTGAKATASKIEEQQSVAGVA